MRSRASRSWPTPWTTGSTSSVLETRLDTEELHELERNCTPCDVINDYTAGKRILRRARPWHERVVT